MLLKWQLLYLHYQNFLCFGCLEYIFLTNYSLSIYILDLQYLLKNTFKKAFQNSLHIQLNFLFLKQKMHIGFEAMHLEYLNSRVKKLMYKRQKISVGFRKSLD